LSLRGKRVADPLDQRWIDLIAEYGHAICKVADRIDEPSDEPPFAYSLGAYESYGVPELILFGLDGGVAADIINDVMSDIKEGRRFGCGIPEYGLLNGDVPLVFLEASPAKALRYATNADWYYERAPFPIRQVFWPAKNGCFPWDADCPTGVKDDQPDLTAGDYLGHPE